MPQVKATANTANTEAGNETKAKPVKLQSLYIKTPKIHVKSVDGLFAKLRVLSAWSLLGWFYGIPWINWHGRQAILFDLPARKFHLFGLTLWPQDFVYLTGLLILAALCLFFVTALAGRLWCGYACPQTVWTKVFIWMERITEGERNARIRLQNAPISAHKVFVKLQKHSLWVLFSFFTGYTFVGYFLPIRELSSAMLAGTLGGWAWFWVAFYGFATWGNAGKLREQVCIYMCPYARFQGAMFDRDTLIIAYDQKRGEPRGARKRDEARGESGKGDCIDCQQCVQVCPTGIDIRKGLQMECIACAACIDACDEIMVKMDYPKGLIRYSTERRDAGGVTRIFRPRIVLYAGLLLCLMGLFVLSLFMRIPLEVDVIRDRGRLYSMTTLGTVENVYQIKIMNKDQHEHRYRLTVQTPADSALKGTTEFAVAGGEIYTLPVRIEIDPYLLKSSHSDIVFTVTDVVDEDNKVSTPSSFIKPGSARVRP